MRNLTFDPGKMYISVFFSSPLIYCKKNLENFVCNKYIYVPSIFWENFINVHAIFFK